MLKISIPFIVLLLTGCFVPGQKHKPEPGPYTTEESSWIWVHDTPPAVYYSAAPDPAAVLRVRITNNGGTILEPGTVDISLGGVVTSYPVRRLAYMEADEITVQLWNGADITADLPLVVDYVGHQSGHANAFGVVHYVAGSGG